jgi:RimJ/RimL family protein N-acetyltransferase
MATNKVKLRRKRIADAPLDYAWKTDAELAELDAAPQPRISFQQYLSEYGRELHHPSSNRKQFAIETLAGKHIGNCTYYNINNTRGEAELGIMIGDRDYWDKGYGANAITALVNYILQHTKLNRIYLKTLVSNTRAQRCFTKCGFIPYGQKKLDGYNFMLMELYRKR